MSGFGVPVKVEGLTDVNQGLINIQRSLSDLFQRISDVSISANIQVNTQGPGISGGPITTTGTLTVQWNAGQVNSLGSSLTLVAGALTVVSVRGVTDGSNAAAGLVGEFLSSTVASGAAVALTTGAARNVTTLPLTAGDWDVGASIGFIAGATTSMSFLSGGISQVTNTMPVSPDTGAVAGFNNTFTTGTNNFFPVGVTRVSLAAAGNVFLVASANFAASTLGAYGFIGARRRR